MSKCWQHAKPADPAHARSIRVNQYFRLIIIIIVIGARTWWWCWAMRAEEKFKRAHLFHVRYDLTAKCYFLHGRTNKNIVLSSVLKYKQVMKTTLKNVHLKTTLKNKFSKWVFCFVLINIHPSARKIDPSVYRFVLKLIFTVRLNGFPLQFMNCTQTDFTLPTNHLVDYDRTWCSACFYLGYYSRTN